MQNRVAWSDYFMSIAHIVAERSTCLRKKVGAVAVKDKRILATGYNGAPSKLPHAETVGCLRAQLGVPSGERHELCRGLHAEQNIIIQAAVYGLSLNGSEIYCTHQPCLTCSKMLINCNITHIWYITPYPNDLALKMLSEANIQIQQISYTQINPIPGLS